MLSEQRMRMSAKVIACAVGCMLVCGAQAAEERFVAVELEQNVTALEPLKGLVFWQDLARAKHATYGSAIALEFLYLLYSDVVVGAAADGTLTYDWSSFERALDAARTRGHQTVVRLRYTEPGAAATAVPAHIKQSSGYAETTNVLSSGETVHYPDWRSPALMAFHKQFYTDLARRYDGDSRVAFFQSGFGHWAEYHTSGTPVALGTNFPSKDFQAEFFQHVERLFVQTPLSFGINSASAAYSPVPERAELAPLSYGLFDDSFMHAQHDVWQGGGYNERLLLAYNHSTRHLRAPVGGEISYYTSADQHDFLGPHGIHGTTWENASAKYHVTYMLANDCLAGAYATPARVRAAGMHAGYHLLVTDFRVARTRARVTVRNTGIAPVYHPLFVTVNGVRAPHSLQRLAPGSNATYEVTGLAIDLDNITATLTITSDKLYPGQHVPFEAHVSASAASLVRVPRLFLATAALVLTLGVSLLW